MTYTEFEKEVVTEFTNLLAKGKFINGDTNSTSTINSSSKFPFYRYFNSNHDSQGKPFLVYDIVPVNNGVYADNDPQAYFVTIGVDIILSNVFSTKTESVVRTELEETIAKDERWQAYYSGSSLDTDNKRKVISYDFRRLFPYGE